MLITDRSFYVIKQSDGTTWDFSCNKYNEIIYKFSKGNTWSEYYVLSEETSRNFSVILLDDDSIDVLYKDLNGTILLSKYDGNKWRKEEILKNDKNHMFDVYFKAIGNENKIHLIFSILNKEKNITTLFHEILDEENNLSPPKIIDAIKYNYNVQFTVCITSNKELFIIYQQFMNNHQIGYKVFNKDIKKWSDFNLIDKSKYPFNDYSMAIVNGILHTLYIKKEENINSLIYVHGNNFNKKLFQGINIESCSVSIICGQIWCSWSENNEIYSSFSIDDGNNFSTPPYEHSLNSQYIFKGNYLSNDHKEVKQIFGNEIYIASDDKSQYLILFTLYQYIRSNQNSNDYLSYMEYFMTQIYLKILAYEKIFKQNEQLVAQLNYQLEEQKVQTQLYERKYKDLSNISSKFMNVKNELNAMINLLQESLANKEDKLEYLEKIIEYKENELLSLRNKLSNEEINILSLMKEIKELNSKTEKLQSLENMNIEKEKHIVSLKDKLSQEENKNLSLMKEIKNSKDKISDLNSQLTEANSKLNISLFEKIFNK